MLAVSLVRLDPGLPIPARAKADDGGVDLYARIDADLLAGGGRAVVPTGIALAIPVGYAGFVQPRSGLAARHGVTCLNAPGLIDAGYRGEVAVVLVNTDPSLIYRIRRGDRIAQLVVQQVEQPIFVEVEVGELAATDRGSGGFGHSGA
jgi:dUTP pyrophosphatase